MTDKKTYGLLLTPWWGVSPSTSSGQALRLRFLRLTQDKQLWFDGLTMNGKKAFSGKRMVAG